MELQLVMRQDEFYVPAKLAEFKQRFLDTDIIVSAGGKIFTNLEEVGSGTLSPLICERPFHEEAIYATLDELIKAARKIPSDMDIVAYSLRPALYEGYKFIPTRDPSFHKIPMRSHPVLILPITFYRYG